MTTTEAINTARHEITMHRQGKGWCVRCPYRYSWMPGDEMPYAAARAWVRVLRVERALDLLGRYDEYAVHHALESGRCFEKCVREIVRQ